jgi:hypothetical protein
VLVPLDSVYRPGRTLEGTRLTLVRQPNGLEFSIRTPGTPRRWADYEQEMGLAWGRVLAALEGGRREEVADAVLAFGYFWYNLMPLARGTAGSGYASVLGMFYAAGLNVTASIPPNYQVGGLGAGLRATVRAQRRPRAPPAGAPGPFASRCLLGGWPPGQLAQPGGPPPSRARCQEGPL